MKEGAGKMRSWKERKRGKTDTGISRRGMMGQEDTKRDMTNDRGVMGERQRHFKAILAHSTHSGFYKKRTYCAFT